MEKPFDYELLEKLYEKQDEFYDAITKKSQFLLTPQTASLGGLAATINFAHGPTWTFSRWIVLSMAGILIFLSVFLNLLSLIEDGYHDFVDDPAKIANFKFPENFKTEITFPVISKSTTNVMEYGRPLYRFSAWLC